jgi:hypothetical protein
MTSSKHLALALSMNPKRSNTEDESFEEFVNAAERILSNDEITFLILFLETEFDSKSKDALLRLIEQR